MYGDLALTIEGGSGGANAIDDTRTGGGGGGGGLFISSLSGLTIGSSGIVSGDGGDGAVSGFGASGGGSGGGIVLFDPVVTNDGTVHADGGDGGKGGGFGAGGGGGGGRILVAGAPAGTGTYSLVGGQTGICCPSGQSPGQLGEDGAGGVLTIDPDAFPKCAVLTNSFLVYDTRVRPPKFESREVMLADQFETGVFEVESLELLGNPADLNDEGITNSDTHMVGYEIEPADDAEHVRVTIRVTSRFGEIVVDTVKPDRLLVPSAKSLGNPVDPLDPGADHFKCYRVELAEGPPEFTTEPVFVQDQFIGEPKLFDVEEPIRLCNPVDKNGEGIADADTHLMCFKVKPADGEPGFKMVRDIHTNNQFGPLQMVAIAEEELCVPSEIEIVE